MSESSAPLSDFYDLLIIGASASGLSVAVSSLKSGLRLVRMIEPDGDVAFPELVTLHGLDLGYGEHVVSMDLDDDTLIVVTDRRSYRARAVLVADRMSDTTWRPSISVPQSPHVHVGDAVLASGSLDVCVVGETDHAVELAVRYTTVGHRVVLAAGGMDPAKLSPAASAILRRLERDRLATILYRASPMKVDLIEGLPLVDFGDRRTPDLQFDHLVFAPPRLTPNPDDFAITDAAMKSKRVWFVGDGDATGSGSTAPGNEVGMAIAQACFPEVDTSQQPSRQERRSRHPEAMAELREEHYNATITKFDPHHSDLWVLRVKPDMGSASFRPGQYATLGLGYWEPRCDDAFDAEADRQWDRLIRRSYSISSRIFDAHGYLADDTTAGELEFYIVLVRPTDDNTPALTPRLATKKPGDRIYLGPKVTGRYTIDTLRDPHAEIVFFGTGTGEAPHNAMIVELLRRGHVGPIISAVTVRRRSDLGYLEKHEQLRQRHPNYHYLPMPTREPGVPKRYLQDLIVDDDFKNVLGVTLSPETTHFFLCGNPAMIGLPTEGEEGGDPVFPETTGVVQLLVERGYLLDRHGQPGNIHFEEYW